MLHHQQDTAETALSRWCHRGATGGLISRAPAGKLAADAAGLITRAPRVAIWIAANQL